ncbi:MULTISPECIES: DUF6602 domain-containing protein [Sphingobium]|jgi:hypothetical protein|uniref:DUF6602 domain-containing protein n=1 Tax=Sphingobium TaxID=165695 RepID=UPI0028AE4FA1|nr:DUF6602 domain-containing protein [Sphingobium yanoikuyae]
MSVAKFFDLETLKISADGDLVSLFTTHPGTLGAFREARLRSFLRAHIGTRHELSSGFILDHDDGSDQIADRTSRQIDCLIFDPSRQAPLIAADSFVAVVPTHVGGFVEVKSNLGINRTWADKQSDEHPFQDHGRFYRWSGSLVEALSNLLSAIKIMRSAGIGRADFFAGIFSYDGDDLLQLEKALVSGELIKQLQIRDLDDLPDCICVLTRGWWSFSAYQWNDVDPEWVSDYDPATSYILSVKSGAPPANGAPLQLFTAYLSHVFDTREGLDHRTGGLRSFAGRNATVANTSIALPCPGKGS